MKKVFAMLAAFTVVIIAVSLVLLPSKALSVKPQKQSAEVKAMPDNVKKILQNDCADCHSSTGNPFAKSHFNLTTWNEMKPDKQAKKAEDICKILRKNSMPPKPFRDTHPDLVPSQKDVDAICTWASGY